MRDLADMHVHISNLNFDKAEALLDVIQSSRDLCTFLLPIKLL